MNLYAQRAARRGHAFTLSLKDYEAFWKLFETNPKFYFSDDCKDLVQQMMQYDPKDRIKLHDIMTHKWFKSIEGRIQSSEEAKDKIFEIRKDLKEAKRGSGSTTRGEAQFLSGDNGSTAYMESDIDYEI